MDCRTTERSTSDGLGSVSWIQKAALQLYRRNVPLLHTSRYVIACGSVLPGPPPLHVYYCRRQVLGWEGLGTRLISKYMYQGHCSWRWENFSRLWHIADLAYCIFPRSNTITTIYFIMGFTVTAVWGWPLIKGRVHSTQHQLTKFSAKWKSQLKVQGDVWCCDTDWNNT